VNFFVYNLGKGFYYRYFIDCLEKKNSYIQSLILIKIKFIEINSSISLVRAENSLILTKYNFVELLLVIFTKILVLNI
jgi:hypothetical protein